MVHLLEVSRSGYYTWVERKPSERAIRREAIEQKIRWFHSDSDEVYGSSRILADLRADGEIISRKTVAATVKRLGLVGICPKKWKTITIVEHEDAYPGDAVKRQWDTGLMNQVRVGDITYLRNWEGWVDLATVIDAHSRRVIGQGDRRLHAHRFDPARTADGARVALDSWPHRRRVLALICRLRPGLVPEVSPGQAMPH
jgi:putative transposase